MWFFYLFSILPVAIGAIIWLKTKQVTWWEWLVGSGICFVVSAIFHLVSVLGMTTDIETWSGKLYKTTRHPRWVERYTETKTRTVGSGKNQRTETYTVTKYRTHPEHWISTGNFGSVEVDLTVSKDKHREIRKSFGGKIRTRRVHKSGFSSGDHNIYVTVNETDAMHPVTTLKRWENRVKAAPSLFSYAKPPEGAAIFEYPANRNSWQSDRLLGTAKKDMGIYAWDCMNTRLGPIKKVNVILVGFGSKDRMLGQYQEAKWIGGKKNDLVLCYGDGWSYVFGWTEQEIVKRNLETILINDPVNNTLISKIEDEIVKNYVIKDWSKFDYIKVEPPWWSYLIFFIVMIAAQIGFYFWAHWNDFETRSGI